MFGKIKKYRQVCRLIIFVFILSGWFGLYAGAASAAEPVGYVPLAAIPGTGVDNCDPTADPNCKVTLNSYLPGIYKAGIAIAGVLAFLVIVWGGFTYLTTDSFTGKSEGKATVIRALGGLLLALASFIILKTINPNLVSLNLNFGQGARGAQDNDIFTTLQIKNAIQQSADNLKAAADAMRASREGQGGVIESQAEADRWAKILSDNPRISEIGIKYFANPQDPSLSDAQKAEIKDLIETQKAWSDRADTIAAYQGGQGGINRHLNDVLNNDKGPASIEQSAQMMQNEVKRDMDALNKLNRADAANQLKKDANDALLQICKKAYPPVKDDPNRDFFIQNIDKNIQDKKFSDCINKYKL